jgi:hypothetical protein
MPYITEAISIDCPFMDKRTKLLPCQREMIVHYSNQGVSGHKLAKMFNVSRRSIQFILNPDALKNNRERREERGGWKQYYDRQKNNDYQKTHRRDKHKLLKETVK